MTMAALMHLHHTVDAFDHTTGPHRVSQECIHPPLGTLPLWTPSLTQHMLDHDQLTETNTGVTFVRIHTGTYGFARQRTRGCSRSLILMSWMSFFSPLSARTGLCRAST
jgi:hypothetical protein